MRTTTYKAFLNRISSLAGIPYSDLQGEEEGLIRQHFNAAINYIWHYTTWPHVCAVEERTPSSRQVSFEQSGETEMGHVIAVYDKDPYAGEEPTRLPIAILQNGILLIGDEDYDSVWVWFRKRCPVFDGSDYSASATYAVGDVVYYDSTGNFHKCIAVSTGNAPSDTDYWEVLEIPYDWLSPITMMAYAYMLMSEGQNEKAALHMSMFERALDLELDNMERQQGAIMETVFNTHLSSYRN